MSIRTKLKKLVCLPSPVELGKSTRNALPSKIWGAKPGDYTWEAYEEEVKEKFPVRYFLSYTLSDWWWKFYHIFIKPIDKLWYWIKCHTRKKYKFHLVDIRNYEYKHGYLDPSEQLLYACFAILDRYVKTRDPEFQLKAIKEYWARNEFCYGSKENDEERMAVYQEFLDLHKWWHKDRPALKEKMDKALDYKKDGKYLDYDNYNNLEKRLENEEKDAIQRLAKIRSYMWV